MKKHMKKGKEEKTKCSKILPNNQIITACRIELRVQEMTMNQKLTMIGLKNEENGKTFTRCYTVALKFLDEFNANFVLSSYRLINI